MEIEVPKKIKVSRNVVSIIVVVLVAVISFYIGTRYQKNHQPVMAASNTRSTAGGGFGGGFGGAGGRFGGTRRGVLGSVTAISSSSITVQGTADNTSHTYSITSTTTISNNGQTAAATDIQNGNTVLVVANPSDTSQAARILINPSFGGGAAGGNAPTSNQQD